MSNKDSKSHGKQTEYSAGRGMALRVLIAAVSIALIVVGIMILSQLNVGEAPSIFGHSLEGIF